MFHALFVAIPALILATETATAEEPPPGLEKMVLLLTTDTRESRNEGRSMLKEGGFTDQDVWSTVETAVRKKDSTLLTGTFQAFLITGFTNEDLKAQLRKLFQEEKLRIETLKEWGEIVSTLEEVNIDRQEILNLHFEVSWRHWVIHAAFAFLGKELDEVGDIHPYLRPEWHAIMLDALRWTEKNGTRKSIPVLESILATEPENFSTGSIGDHATRARRAISERMAAD